MPYLISALCFILIASLYDWANVSYRIVFFIILAAAVTGLTLNIRKGGKNYLKTLRKDWIAGISMYVFLILLFANNYLNAYGDIISIVAFVLCQIFLVVGIIVSFRSEKYLIEE